MRGRCMILARLSDATRQPRTFEVFAKLAKVAEATGRGDVGARENCPGRISLSGIQVVQPRIARIELAPAP